MEGRNLRIRRIMLENYRQFLRKTIINLSFDPEKNVNVIHGGGGSGKTNLLNAIRWCLYGAEDPGWESERGASHIINGSVFRDCPMGGAVLASVTIELWDHAKDNVVYSIQRQISATKSNEEKLQLWNSEVHVRMKSAKSSRRAELSTSPSFVDEFLSGRVTDMMFLDGITLGDLFKVGRDSDLLEAIEREPKAAWLKRIVGCIRDRCSEELSAGERQALAYVVLDLLQECNEADAPIIVDVPMQVLTEEMRERVAGPLLKRLAEKRQVILFMNEAEYTDRIRDILGDRIGREYQLVRDRVCEWTRLRLVNRAYSASSE